MNPVQREGVWFVGRVRQPECFGLLCEVDTPGQDGQDCRECVFAVPCRARFVAVEIPRAADAVQAAGKSATAVQIARYLGVSVRSVEVGLSGDESPGDVTWQSGWCGQKGVARVARTGAEWGPARDEVRWRRERSRSAAVAALTPGTLLRREYKGVLYTCKVMTRGYVYEGRLYPTLYAVTKAAIGTRPAPAQNGSDVTRQLVVMSALRFWRLGAYAKAPSKRRR